MRVVHARPRRDSLARGIALLGTLGCVAWAMVAADPDRLSWLFGVLALGAVGATLFDARTEAQRVTISAAALAAILVLAFFGPAWAFVVAALSELPSWALERYPPQRLAVVRSGPRPPVLIAGAVFEAVHPAGEGTAGFYLALALAAVLVFVLNLLIVGGLTAPLDGIPLLH